MSDFQTAKLWLVGLAGLGKDALHIYVGLAVFLGFAAVFRLPLGSWRPIAAVLLVALAGEVWDLAETYGGGGAPAWERSAHDVVNTMFWPLVLFVLARWTRMLKR